MLFFVWMERTIKVAIVGAESTGKSTLAAALAAHFQTVWVPEYARDYIGNLNRPYTANDIIAIAEGQLKLEDEYYRQANGILFCDTTLLVEKVWIENAFGFCPPEIENNIGNRNYSLHLLTNIDLPWEYDPQREHPHLREYFHNLYKKHLIAFGFPFIEISGTGAERVQRGVEAVRGFVNKVKAA